MARKKKDISVEWIEENDHEIKPPQIDGPSKFMRRITFPWLQIEEAIKDHDLDIADVMVKVASNFNQPILLELSGYDWFAYPGETVEQVVERLKKHQEDERSKKIGAAMKQPLFPGKQPSMTLSPKARVGRNRK